jgi:hypothetical protein
MVEMKEYNGRLTFSETVFIPIFMETRQSVEHISDEKMLGHNDFTG